MEPAWLRSGGSLIDLDVMAANNTGSAGTLVRRSVTLRWLITAAAAGVAAGLLATRVSTPPLVLAAAVGLLGAAAIVAVPELGLLALAFSTFVNLSGVLTGHFDAPVTLMTLLVPVVALAVLAQWFWRRRPPEGWLRPALLVATFGVAGILSLLAATDPARTLDGLARIAKDGIIAVLVVTLIHRGATLRRVLWTLLAAGLLMGTISVHQHLTGNFAFDYWGLASEPRTWGGSDQAVHRVTGPIGNPNSYGLILLILVPIAVDRLACRGRLAPRILALWALVVCSLSIVFTYSRGAFVALVAMLAFLLIVRRPRLRGVLIAAGVAALLMPLVPSSYVHRMATLVGAIRQPEETIGVQDASLRGRLSENLAAGQMFLDHPLIGVGLGNYPVRYQDYSQQLMLDSRSTERSPHSLYLEIAAETGIVGLLALGIILWVPIRCILDARRSLRDPKLAEIRGMADAIAIGLLGYLVGSFFLHATHMRYFWLLAGIALALPRVASTELAALRLESGEDGLSPRDDS